MLAIKYFILSVGRERLLGSKALVKSITGKHVTRFPDVVSCGFHQGFRSQ